ncbi:TRAP transporter large permease subunit [Comamonadaceae bacterium OH2545_COT-014]|nr:TRAP transporter large permease subunit [Comamonadaceae bacterium OH2545_COT-014]
MEAFAVAVAVLAMIFITLGLGVWVFAGLLLVAVASLLCIAGFSVDRIGVIVKSIVWKSASTWELAAIPLFLWMGEIIFRSDISERLFRGLAPLVEWLPGRLLHTNVMGCTLFAAVSGSTSATTATVGKITTTALRERGYDSQLSLGSLAGAGSLGLLIPPSIIMIIYGVLAEVSIAKLFAAGVAPGLLVAAIFSTYIMVRCALRPELAPASGGRVTLPQLLRAVADLLPIGVLIVTVLGGIYSGIVTPSEAAAVGVFAAVVLTALLGRLSWAVLSESLMAAVRTSCMVCSILVSAAVLSTAIGYMHIPAGLTQGIAALELPPYALLFLVALLYIVLGLFLDGISIVVMSLPVTLPIIVQAGFDPVWFGVFLVLMVELGQVTPPVGFNLFVLQGITGASLSTVVYAALPFFLLMCLAVVLISVMPSIVLYLPSLLTQ